MQQSASLTASRTTCCTTNPQQIEANGVRALLFRDGVGLTTRADTEPLSTG